MHTVLTFAAPIEAQVQFVEETAPEEIVGATVARIREGATA